MITREGGGEKCKSGAQILWFDERSIRSDERRRGKITLNNNNKRTKEQQRTANYKEYNDDNNRQSVNERANKH